MRALSEVIKLQLARESLRRHDLCVFERGGDLGPPGSAHRELIFLKAAPVIASIDAQQGIRDAK
jgi:hypothetical protein